MHSASRRRPGGAVEREGGWGGLVDDHPRHPVRLAQPGGAEGAWTSSCVAGAMRRGSG
ncbi:MAG TPA: hypothetical protein VIA06_03215 [Candidatus Dormibacteraeota bacterium]|nr:hypothetical protein [Candidatus Dormibacteraeota bacterium]